MIRIRSQASAPQPPRDASQQPSRQRRTMEDPAARTMEDPAARTMKEASRPSPSPTEDTKALCGAITPGAEGLPSSVPDAHLPNARLPPCGGPSPPFACSRVLMPRAAAPYPDPRSDGRGSFPPLARLRRSWKVMRVCSLRPGGERGSREIRPGTSGGTLSSWRVVSGRGRDAVREVRREQGGGGGRMG